MSEHDMRWAATPKGALKYSPWGWQAACVCGWEQQGLRGTKKDGLEAYKKHKEIRYHHMRCT